MPMLYLYLKQFGSSDYIKDANPFYFLTTIMWIYMSKCVTLYRYEKKVQIAEDWKAVFLSSTLGKVYKTNRSLELCMEN